MTATKHHRNMSVNFKGNLYKTAIFFFFKSSNLYTGCGYFYPINLPTLTCLMGQKGS